MGHIGSFGKAVAEVEQAEKPEPMTFDFYGVTFQCVDRIPFLSFAAYAEVSRRGIGLGDPEGLAAIYNLMKSCLTETYTYTEGEGDAEREVTMNQWAVFEGLCASKGVDLDELFDLISAIQEAIMARPFVPASDSQPGQQSTGKSSKAKPSARGSRSTQSVTMNELEDKEPANAGTN